MNFSAFRPIIPSAVLLALASCSVPQATETTSAIEGTIKIGGSSETYEVLELLTAAYTETATDIEFEYFPPSQTDGGIEGVKAAAVDIGAVSRQVGTAETGEELVYQPLVQTPLVIAVHDSVTGVTNISAEHIKAIYSGEISNWQALGGPDAEIIVFDLAEDENEKRVLRETYLGADLEITPNAVAFAEDDELLETAAITEFSIAALPLEEGLDELPMAILSIDGVEPNTENLQSGVYPMALSLGVVLPATPSDQTESFIEFVESEAGQAVLTEADYVLAK
ncbi:MAG: substrate-binding domain-containing protein [Cyanobacteria bacterium J06628_6]